MAEREGFEPSERLRAQRFSRPPRSTTPAPLRRFDTMPVGGAPYLIGIDPGDKRGSHALPVLPGAETPRGSSGRSRPVGRSHGAKPRCRRRGVAAVVRARRAPARGAGTAPEGSAQRGTWPAGRASAARASAAEPDVPRVGTAGTGWRPERAVRLASRVRRRPGAAVTTRLASPRLSSPPVSPRLPFSSPPAPWRRASPSGQLLASRSRGLAFSWPPVLLASRPAAPTVAVGATICCRPAPSTAGAGRAISRVGHGRGRGCGPCAPRTPGGRAPCSSRASTT